MSAPIYIICKADDHSALAAEVNRYLEEGFDCVGGVCHSVVTFEGYKHGDTIQEFVEVWSQAVIKELA